MKISFKLLSSAAAVALLVSVSPAVLSQSAPSKQAVQKKGGDGLMTKDELRSCMALKERNKARKAALDKGLAELRAQRDAMNQQAPKESNEVQARVNAQMEKVKQADAAVKAHAEQVEDWNTRMEEFEKNSKEMRNADRRRNVLKQERAELNASAKGLTEARDEQVRIYDELIKTANGQLNQGAASAAAEWNKRNDALADEQDSLIDDQATYSADCANRRFREEDEAAIKAGK